MTVSEDGIVGTGQKGNTFWTVITEKFNEAGQGEVPLRSEKSLQCKWGDISRECKKFTGFYNTQERLNESGTTEEDKINKALEQFRAELGSMNKKGQYLPKQFSYMDCWQILKGHPRWQSMCSDKSPSAVMEKDTARPEGRKAQKDARAAKQQDGGDAVANAILTGLKRKATALEDANAMVLLNDATCPEDVRKRGMKLLRKKLMRRLEEDDSSDGGDSDGGGDSNGNGAEEESNGNGTEEESNGSVGEGYDPLSPEYSVF